MARADLKFDLTAALHEAKNEKKSTIRKGIRIKYNGVYCVVDLTISPFTDKNLPPGLLLALFEDKTSDHTAQDAPAKTTRKNNKGEKVKKLEQELHSIREYLQATTEELETSKEELQSTNEELNTVNTELQSKVHELSRVSDDMNNLLTATDIASIFLDTRLCIQRYTPAAARIIKLIPTDIGRPLDDLKTSFPQVDLAGQTQKVLDDLNTMEMKVMSEDHVWYQLRAMPYRTMENVIDGVVLTLIKRTWSARCSAVLSTVTTRISGIFIASAFWKPGIFNPPT